jgi:NADPH:quinone reductase-like Zn-dependent oxidoreductase
MAQRSWKQGEPLVLLELPTPEPRRGEVRVAVKAIGVNPVDWKMRSAGPLRLAARLLGPPAPVVVGVDFAGVVDAIGEGVTGFEVGARVVGGTNFSRGQPGSYGDTVMVREDQLCRLPDGVEDDVAGSLPITGVTAWRSVVELGRIRRATADARRVLVLGASGGVGQLATQIAKLEGAFVAGVCSGKNVDLVRSLGVDAALDYNQGDPLAQAEALGRFHVVIDCVGSYSGRRCRRLLSPGGRHVMVAAASPSSMAQAFVPPFSSKIVLGKPTGAHLEPVVAALAAGKLRVNIAHRLRLDEAEEAHRLSRTGRLTGRIILVP